MFTKNPFLKAMKKTTYLLVFFQLKTSQHDSNEDVKIYFYI